MHHSAAISKKIKRALKAAGVTQRDIAERSGNGVDTGVVSRAVNGIAHTLRVETEIAKAIGHNPFSPAKYRRPQKAKDGNGEPAGTPASHPPYGSEETS